MQFDNHARNNAAVSRHHCIELVDLQTEACSQVQVTGLSLYGCGVSSKPFPSGTKLRIRINNNGHTFSALGKVAYANADDIGIVFTRVDPSDQVTLEKWISERVR